MSAVIAVPELMEATAADLATIGSTLDTARLKAASATVSVSPAAADEVSAAIAGLFTSYAEDYQTLAAQAVASYDQFVQRLSAGAVSYASAEAANFAALLYSLALYGVAPSDAIGFNDLFAFVTPVVVLRLFGLFNSLYSNPSAFNFFAFPLALLFLFYSGDAHIV